ncbi:hypothetical protein PSEUBRA_006028 [Kalmanozyma brasiliensis GHG001]|uniref:Proteasome assembly chaperone 1 n=1 Tax=Kalmanozyma brasiliensis (strain GHG001) TaxID=1365824 RepID=V5ES89_KALBG|nr:uncharacterized protein PSEUBRA_006028 [Kalmanozyma brasiliensis GHG001]EST04744.1 hypothetical protein PSEUBRA_006028 [Kalmanozyma brasiliensis GHG001]
MDFDPVNRDAPAPRYELESGSEDEFDHDGVATKIQGQLVLSATEAGSSSTLQQGNPLVVLVRNAGAAFLSSLQGHRLEQRYSLRADSEQHASIAVASSSSGSSITVAMVAPPPQLRSSRFHEIASTLLEATKPSKVVIVDSYSQEQQLYRDTDSESDSENEAAIKYLATPTFLAEEKVDSKRMEPLRSPETASGLGAAFLSKAVINGVPAILTLLEDVTFQSHVQLYGSLGASRLSPSASKTLASLTGLDSIVASSAANSPSTGSTLSDFVASRRVKPAANLAVLGDGNMYI